MSCGQTGFNRRVSLRLATLFTVATGGFAGPGSTLAGSGSALAADPVTTTADAVGTDPTNMLQQVTVTARKVKEDLQTVPLTVSVVSAQMLEDLDIDRPEDLARVTPGFHYEDTGARFWNKPTIRGMSDNSIEYNDQKAQTFIDGVAFAGQFGSYPINDGEYQQIEVLKGPQSTAFGRGTLAGGINYITKDPDNEQSAILSAEGRTNTETHDYLFINQPIISDILSSYFSLNYYSYGGPPGIFGHDQFNGAQLGDENSKDIAVKFKYTPTDWLIFKLRGSYGDDVDGLPTFNFLAPSQANGTFVKPDGSIIKLPVGPISASTMPVAWPDTQMFDPGLRRQTWRSEFTGIADLGPITLTSVTGFNRQRDSITYGAEGTFYCYLAPVFLGCPYYGPAVPGEVDGEQMPQIETYEDLQQEMRLASNSQVPFKYLLGFDFFRWHWFEDFTGLAIGDDTVVNSKAAFGNASYQIGDATIGLEGRYNSDRISYKTLNGDFGPTATQTFNRFLPRFTLDYRLTPNVMPYIVVSEGNHPGTFTDSTNPAVSAPAPVKEEILWNYEAGIKSEFLDHRLRMNVAAYYDVWRNQQLIENALFFSDLTQSYQKVEVLTNAGRSHIHGFEAEIDVLPMPGLNLRGTVAYDHAVFDSFCSPQYYGITGIGNAQLGCRSVAGKTLPQQPPLTASLIAGYDVPLGPEWTFFSIAEYSFLDKKYSDETNLTWTPDSNLVNVHLGLGTATTRLELFVLNLTQENAPVRASTRLDYQLLGSRYGDYNTDAVPQKPRQFGVKATYKFH